MKSKKRVIALAVSMALLLICFVGATFAYFTDTEFNKDNVITIGNVEIDLYEHSEEYAADPGADVLEENDTKYRDEFLKADDNINLLPGENVPKYTYIDNTGANDAYVRFVVTVPAELNEFLDLTWNDNYTVTTKAGADNVYYAVRNTALPAGQLSEPGLENVALKLDLTEKDLAEFTNVFDPDTRDFHITVAAHAIQTVGFDGATEAEKAAAAFATFDANGENVQNEK